MENIARLTVLVLLLLLASHASSQGVTLTYQGQLKQSGTPFNGLVDVEFRLYDALTGGSQVGLARDFTDVPVDDGLFQVPLEFTVFDFRDHPSGVFLETRVDGTLLAPRQPVTAAPYAAFALTTFDPDLPWTDVGGGITYTEGDVGIGTTGFASARLRVDAGPNFDGVHATTNASNGWAVYGVASGNFGIGVHGRYDATSGNGAAVRGFSASPQAWGGEFIGGAGIRIDPSDALIPAITLEKGRIEANNGLNIRTTSGSMRLSTGGWMAFNTGAGGDNFRINADGSGRFFGSLEVDGTLSKGGGSFTIDHPLDPANRILQHSFVESPDMMNVYNGIAVTDAEGHARIVMPDYFEALNRDFRYQLTVIGATDGATLNAFPRVIVSEKIRDNAFAIRTDEPFVEVSWQITGIRQDAWAEANRIEVELDKSPERQGRYLHPEAFHQPASAGIASTADDAPRTGPTP